MVICSWSNYVIVPSAPQSKLRDQIIKTPILALFLLPFCELTYSLYYRVYTTLKKPNPSLLFNKYKNNDINDTELVRTLLAIHKEKALYSLLPDMYAPHINDHLISGFINIPFVQQ